MFLVQALWLALSSLSGCQVLSLPGGGKRQEFFVHGSVHKVCVGQAMPVVVVLRILNWVQQVRR